MIATHLQGRYKSAACCGRVGVQFSTKEIKRVDCENCKLTNKYKELKYDTITTSESSGP